MIELGSITTFGDDYIQLAVVAARAALKLTRIRHYVFISVRGTYIIAYQLETHKHCAADNTIKLNLARS